MSAPRVIDTLVVRNGTLVSGNYLAGNVLEPTAIVYDNGTGQYFVAGGTTNNVGVFNATSGAMVASVNVGSHPQGLAYDSGTSQVFVTNGFSNNVSVISDRNNTVVASVGVGRDPAGAVYDAAKGEVFVADLTSDNVSVLSDSSDTVVTSVTISTLLFYVPIALAFDNATGEVYAADENGVDVISDSTNSITHTIATSSFPSTYGIVYDNRTARVFVADSYGNNVSVIDTSNHSVVATVGVGNFPGNIAFDSATGEVFVPNRDSGNLSVISDRTDAVVATVNGTGEGFAAPTTVAYDPLRAAVLVSNSSNDSLELVSDTLHISIGMVLVGSLPGAMAYDAGKAELAIASYDGSTVSFVSDLTNHVTATVPVGTGPFAEVYDPARGEIFVASAASTSTPGFVGVFNDSSEKSVATVAVGYLPETFGYDPRLGEVFVSYDASNVLGIINDSRNNLTGYVPVGGEPFGMAYDPAKAMLYVANYGTNNVSVVNTTTNQVATTIGAGTQPFGIAYDSRTGELFVSNYGSSNVTVINDSTNTVVANIDVGTIPTGIAYVASIGGIIVDDSGQNLVSVISDASDRVTSTVPVGIDPFAVTYDQVNDLVYVVNAFGGTVSILSLPNGTSGPLIGAFTATPAKVALDSTSRFQVTASGGTGALSYAYTGLPGGCASSNASTLACTPTSLGNFTVRVFVNDSVGGSANASAVIDVFATAYPITFTSHGLPLGLTWYINITGEPSIRSVSGSTSVDLANGTYPYQLASANRSYAPAPANSSFRLSGAPRSLTAMFTLVTYNITFVQSGLPVGIDWSIEVAGQLPLQSSSGVVTAPFSNGTYSYSLTTHDPRYRAGPTSSSFNVAGAPELVPVKFSAVLYEVHFSETSLPAGTSWAVTISGASVRTSNSSLTMTEPNGTYTYNASYVAAWTTAQRDGIVIIDGKSPTPVTLQWTRVVYELTFSETGLAAGTNWSVTLGSTTTATTRDSIGLAVPNGTYSVAAGNVSGYAVMGANPPSTSIGGTIVVNGSAQNTTFEFVPIQRLPSPGLLGLQGDGGYLLLGALAIAGGAAVGVFVAIRSRRDREDRRESTGVGSSPEHDRPGSSSDGDVGA